MSDSEPASDADSNDDEKQCRRCGETKLVGEFGLNRRRADGRAQYCRECFTSISKASYRSLRERAGAKVRTPRASVPGMRSCPDCDDLKPLSEFPRHAGNPSGLGTYCKPHHNARGRESKQRVHGGSRHYHLLRRYGVSAEDVAEMIAQQGGACPICLRPLGTRHHVDHDHATGQVRAVLCFTCNGGLGNYGDDAVRLRRAAAYLDGSLGAPSLVAPGAYDVEGLGWRRRSSVADGG